ncbi:MAG: hypothetical protein LQ349_004158 [Xanthoria aureola]|nr:MAG: hypothetical protein LQ349_004158 [Xanthoria aureola]
MATAPFFPSTSPDGLDVEMSNSSENPGPVVGPHPSNLPDGHSCAEGSISMLERLMDESHIQPVGDDGDLDDILCAYETPELSQAEQFKSADQSFDSSYSNLMQLPPLESSDKPEDWTSPELSPCSFTASKATEDPSSEEMIAADPATEPFLWESIYGGPTAFRPWAPAREGGSASCANSKPCTCIFREPSASMERMPLAQLLEPDFWKTLSGVEGEEQVPALPYQAESSAPYPETSKMPMPGSNYLDWMSVVPPSENLPVAPGGAEKRDDWDFSEIRDSEGMDESVKERYKEGKKGFLRLN